MTKKYSFWCINEEIVPLVFKMYRRPSLKELERVKKWVNLNDWNIIGNISPKSTDIRGNEEIIQFFFDNLKSKFNREIELVYSIENNPSNEFQHTHFLVKMEITVSEMKELEKTMFNLYPNFKLERYNLHFGDLGKEYTMKHVDNNLERYGFLTYRK